MPVLICVGLSHKEVSIAVRERVSVPPEQLPARLTRLKELPGVREAMLLSTCNRLEVFAVADAPAAADEVARELGPLAAPHLTRRLEEEALAHLFRVAASLDSMVVGEAQIQGQVKEAHARAMAAGACGPSLSRAVSAALCAAKRVRTETAIARRAVSVSSLAVQMAQKVLGDLAGRSVLLVGAGEMARLAARELRAAGAGELLVANRTEEHARALAADAGGLALGLEELPALLERADVVICSTGAQQAIVTVGLVARALKARRYRPLFLVDLSVPRNVEPEVNELPNTYLYDLDDLERLAARNRRLREEEQLRAEAIVRDELVAYARRKQERTCVPVLARLRAQAQAMADSELERSLAALGPLSERERKSVRALANAIVNKLLHGPTARLRGEQGGPLADAAAELFGLTGAPELEPTLDVAVTASA
jgi:glutamyl-tRNA reductase